MVALVLYQMPGAKSTALNQLESTLRQQGIEYAFYNDVSVFEKYLSNYRYVVFTGYVDVGKYRLDGYRKHYNTMAPKATFYTLHADAVLPLPILNVDELIKELKTEEKEVEEVNIRDKTKDDKIKVNDIIVTTTTTSTTTNTSTDTTTNTSTSTSNDTAIMLITFFLLFAAFVIFICLWAYSA